MHPTEHHLVTLTGELPSLDVACAELYFALGTASVLQIYTTGVRSLKQMWMREGTALLKKLIDCSNIMLFDHVSKAGCKLTIPNNKSLRA